MTAETGVQAVFGRYLPIVEAEIERSLEGRADGLLLEMIRYHLGLDQSDPATRGKRIRPVLCLLTCEAVGGDARAAGPAAAAIELVHAFTLIHDDVADQDELRRGRPTVWRKWGVGQAITAGDAIYSLANAALGRLDKRRFDPLVILDTAELLNRAVLAVCQGQQLDISFEGRGDITIDGYLEMIRLKTASLFAAAAEIGALLGGATGETRRALRRFGQHLGVAFQVQDDVLGVWGDPAETGKTVGGDLKRRKRSLPVLHALMVSQSGARLAARLAEGIRTDEEAADLAREMEAEGSRAYCEEAAAQSLDRALAELRGFRLPPERTENLREFATYLGRRRR